MTKRTPATDVTLSPSLAEILLELVNSYIILLLQAKHREIPLLHACSRDSANSDKRAQRTGNPVGKTCAEASLYRDCRVHDHETPYALGFAG
jgi:hypothetical protein